MVSEGLLEFEGVIAYGTTDTDEAVHFFEHALGLEPAGEGEGEVRFYALGEDMAIAVDTSGNLAGIPPYLLFSTPDLAGAHEHFAQRGFEIADMTDGDGATRGFFASTPEGHTVCVVARDALED